MKQHDFQAVKPFLKKPIAVLSALILCLAPAASVSAAGGQPAAREPQALSESEKASLSEALNGVEAQKNMINELIPGLEDMDFSRLCVGKPVQTYIYANNAFEPSQAMYPITYNDRLIFWAIEDEGKFQITTALVGDINDKLEGSVAFSIVYDRNNAYLYSNNAFTWLANWADAVGNRSLLEPDAVILEKLETVSFSEKLEWEYLPAVAREPIYYGCNVEYVPQKLSNLCWAATIACIMNYCKGESHTPEEFAIYYFVSDDETVYNDGVGDVNVPKVFAHYNMDYTYKDKTPSDSVIGHNIRSDYPVYAGWVTSSGNHHATCIYGINAIGGYVHIMDPEVGFTSASAGSNGYSYVGKSSERLTLIHLVCHSWEVATP